MIDNKEELLANGNEEGRKACLDVIEYALESIEPSRGIEKNVGIEDGMLKLFSEEFELDEVENLYVLGAGKASYNMARAIEEILSDKIAEGIVITKYGYRETELKNIRVVEAGHPVPDDSGQEAANEILRIAEDAGERDLVINLISGGGSALLCAPVEPVSLDEMQKATDLLVASGATINEINAVRKHVSRIKGGRLARSIQPATCVSLIVSDVVGNPLDVIASGPTVPDTTTFEDAYRVLENYSLLEEVPGAVLDYVNDGRDGKVMESVEEDEFADMKVHNLVISSNDKATEAVAEKAEELDLEPLILSRMIEGESKEAGIVFAGIVKDVVRTGTPLDPPAMLISGGETTVSLGEKEGEGGPNQEFALGAATKISGLDGIVVAAVDTDGTDGPTEAAGGIVDGKTAEKFSQENMNLSEVLKSHDSKPALEKLNDLIVTGPTGTNVNDLRIAVVL
ncbi:hypothetical protein AKJ57_01055 [candidate division MSBL1 archaeon SCGC-AAA259A05]|uniref:Glycerate kinase n=1 Tax=candidate division MSBL1 archaeon SCGC-AAA259A05 TaxID=1698259 RepID=A0A133UBE6_9EURY|nr:hypothetical protein AKJ57_01055 [candidate division MSBL1 archaeon SCGC-AAA259A05]